MLGGKEAGVPTTHPWTGGGVKVLKCGLTETWPLLYASFIQHLAIGISDCGFYTPIVLSNCSMKSIESADFYENGVSPAQPFMITLWPRDEGLCCQNCSSNNCWLLTKTTSNCKEKSQNCNPQEIRNDRLAGSQDKNRHKLLFQVDLSLAMLLHISDSSLPSF